MRRILLVTLVVLGLLVVLDRVALLAADHVVAQRIETDQGLSTSPDVSIGGFPFLTQAIAGRYDDVTLTVHDLHRSSVPVQTLSVRLHGVHVPLGAVTSGHLSRVPVDRASASLLLGYADLNAYFGSRGLQVGDGGGGEVSVRATATVAGRRVEVSGRGRLEVRGSDLVAVVGNGLDLSIPLGGLPFRIALVGAKATKAGISVTATAAGLVLHPRE